LPGLSLFDLSIATFAIFPLPTESSLFNKGRNPLHDIAKVKWFSPREIANRVQALQNSACSADFIEVERA
jgi:hypothetical protein